MSHLEEIFQNPDEIKRLSELVEYAKSIKINVLKAKKDDGTYSEDELAVLIFDVESAREQSRRLNVAFWISALIISFFLIIVLYFGVNFFS